MRTEGDAMNRTRRDTILTVGRARDMVAFALGGDGPSYNITVESARRFARMLFDAARDAERERDNIDTPGPLITVLDGCDWLTAA